jgi:hypothetical protein
MMKLKTNKTFTNDQEQIRNKNNVDQIEKHNTINLDWMMKFKTNKTFTKGQKLLLIEICFMFKSKV